MPKRIGGTDNPPTDNRKVRSELYLQSFLAGYFNPEDSGKSGVQLYDETVANLPGVYTNRFLTYKLNIYGIQPEGLYDVGEIFYQNILAWQENKLSITDNTAIDKINAWFENIQVQLGVLFKINGGYYDALKPITLTYVINDKFLFVIDVIFIDDNNNRYPSPLGKYVIYNLPFTDAGGLNSGDVMHVFQPITKAEIQNNFYGEPFNNTIILL